MQSVLTVHQTLPLADSMREPVTETNWYKTELNTAALVKAVVAERPIPALTATDLWRLLQLTWITAGRGEATADHWKRLKVPALAQLFQKIAETSEDLQEAVDRLHLPAPVAQAAAKKTGFVNAYRAYRNSLLGWCEDHRKQICPILDSATKLSSNNQDRFDLASRIALLPRVPTPNNERTMAASSHITPLIACLDPKARFPIINGEAGVNMRLSELGLAQSAFEEQVRGFIGLIGKFGLTDAFAVDTMSEAQMQRITEHAQRKSPPSTGALTGSLLPDYDELERKAVQQSGTIIYRQRHNKMTTQLKQLLPSCQIVQGNSADCRFDALIQNYDGNGRDLLIEAKPDADKGSIRIAIGQLLDYRRFLSNQPAIDMAILTITPPSGSHIELMHDQQITTLWFTEESCLNLAGTGAAWKTLRTRLERS